MPEKLAFVIPWYGEHIGGGAEAACRGLVRALAQQGVGVEVLTTCVRDFRSDWSDNSHPAGTTIETGVPVRRFPVGLRNAARFDRVNARLMQGLAVSGEEEMVFMKEMINSPALYTYLDEHRHEYVYCFLPYMFGTTYWGCQVCPERSILIPCLHDESYAHMRILQPAFGNVRGFILLSPEEQTLAQELYHLDPERTRVGGGPVDCGRTADRQRFIGTYGVSDFLLYAGRTDPGKNAELLVNYFGRFVQEQPSDPTRLVFIGDGKVSVPARCAERIVRLGFLPEQDKFDCYAAARAVCVPSVMESFSIVLMEGWLAGTPAIVNGACAVTTGHCRRSDGGLYFRDYQDFREIVLELRRNPSVGRALGAQGREYVRRNYSPESVVRRYLAALRDWGLAGRNFG